MQESTRIHLPFRTALAMVRDYVRTRLMEQVKAVSFILVYLAGFQMLVLGTTPANAWQIAGGVALVVIGLTCFLEGLLLGLMPLGERVGVQLPQKSNLFAVIVFGLLLGFGSTLAEPAIAALREAGSNVTPWDAPLLYRLLANEPGRLVAAIGAGVGVAVAFGMLRFFYGISIKPFVFVVIPILLTATVACAFDPNLRDILGLAWDTGAVTTGPVTVPLVLALGIGVSRALGKQEGTADGFGVVMLASAFPVLGVLILGAALNVTTPKPMAEADFFASANRDTAVRLAQSEHNLLRLAFQRGSGTARSVLYGDDAVLRETVRSLADRTTRSELLGTMALQEWLTQRASTAERLMISADLLKSAAPQEAARQNSAEVVAKEAALSVRAIIPLTVLLLIVLVALLRDAPRHPDETVFGIVLALVGMTLLTSGIKLGLAPMGDEVGRPLPRVFRSVAREEGRILLEPFEADRVLTTYTLDGTPNRFFYLQDTTGTPRPVSFDPGRYDAAARRYEHIVQRPPLFGPELTLAGIALVFLFAFGLGYGSTLAEPSLSALGRTVEELTVGTIRRRSVVRAVSIGVGIGLMVGVARILYGIPTVWLILPPYLALLPLTYWSEEDFAGIAWDCGGVTTGPITVPLVLAMGLGIGGELNVVDGFGVLAMASVYPIITVLLFGLLARARHRRSFTAPEEGHGDE